LRYSILGRHWPALRQTVDLNAHAGVSALEHTLRSRTTAAAPRRDVHEGCRCIASPRWRARCCAATQTGC